MADVRSLLRSEQAARRISHPNLSYTKSGLLNCLVCNLLIKSESLWEGHLRSPNHKKNLQKSQNGASLDGNSNASRKRKLEDNNDEGRKKNKQQPELQGETASDAGPVEATAPVSQNEESKPEDPQPEQQAAPETSVQPQPIPSQQDQIDEDEWAAFNREVVPLTHANYNQPPNYTSSATISAAPITAAELAAQNASERQQQREADVEDEQAEEQTRLVEEFDVMEGLEERVRKLREKREALRTGAQAGIITAVDGDAEAGDADTAKTGAEERPPDPDEKEDEEDEEDDSEDVDGWGF